MPDITTEATLVDSAGNLYSAIWKPRLDRGSLTDGWSTFASDHCLQAGDVCVFEVTNFTELTILVHIFRRDDDNNRLQSAFADGESLGRISSASTSLQSKSINRQEKTSPGDQFVEDHGKVALASQRHHPISEGDKCRDILAAYKFKVKNPSFTVCYSVSQHFVLVSAHPKAYPTSMSGVAMLLRAAVLITASTFQVMVSCRSDVEFLWSQAYSSTLVDRNCNFSPCNRGGGRRL